MSNFVENYYKLLTEDFKGINLTRIIDYAEFKNKQIEDSIQPLEQSDLFSSEIMKNGLVVDVGFGGGFPILPLANELPNIQFVGVETRGKKVKVVSQIASALGLGNVVLNHNRIENILIDKSAVITFKAVGKVFDFLSRINVSADNVCVFFYKGPNFYELEKDQLESAKQDWEIIEEKVIKLEDVEKRYLIGFKYKKVPHRTSAKSLNNLVKLTDLI